MKIYRFIKLALFIAFSVLIFVFRNELVSNLPFFIGAVILGYGVENIGVLAFVEKKECFKNSKFTFSFFEIILGITTIVVITDFAYACIVWAVWSMLRQSIDIYEVLSGGVKGVVAIILLIESVISIVFGILLIIHPTEHHAIHHIYLLIAELMVISLPPVIDEIIAFSKSNKEKKNS